MKNVLLTEFAPAAIGPYSQGISANKMAFISGQLPIDPVTGNFAGDDIKMQTKQSIMNIMAILKSDGMTLENVVKTTVYLKNISDFAAMNEIYGQYFKSDPPARSAIGISALPKDALVEIEAIAAK